MLLRRVIPCLDVKDGRVVKGVRFVDLTDEGDPPELARRYAEAGADEIIYFGSLTAFSDTGLSDSTSYCYEIWSYDTCLNYQAGPPDSTTRPSTITWTWSGFMYRRIRL